MKAGESHARLGRGEPVGPWQEMGIEHKPALHDAHQWFTGHGHVVAMA